MASKNPALPILQPESSEAVLRDFFRSHGEKRLAIRTAAPELGQDNEEILTSVGYGKEQIADLAQRGMI
jgi:crotonobetainyl-CoA:carnitine CoA-transferase CaiB-like acyl-CoA transferase